MCFTSSENQTKKLWKKQKNKPTQTNRPKQNLKTNEKGKKIQPQTWEIKVLQHANKSSGSSKKNSVLQCRVTSLEIN